MYTTMKIFILFILAVTSFFALVRYFEANSIFHPTHEIPVTPAFVGLPFEDVYFKTEDNLRINGWLIKAPQASSAPAPKTILFFHGNAGNISHRLEKIALFHQLGVNVFIIDYRGYGKSQGRPSEEGLYQDACGAYDYLATRRDINPAKIISYGDSLGGVVAVDLATKRKVACLVVDSSFTSSADIGKMIFPLVPGFILATKMDSASKVKTISIPKLFIHSINDEIIPFKLGRKLFDSACMPKEFLQITGGHNTNHIDSRAILMEGLTKFFKGLDL